MNHLLDNITWFSLTGHQARYASGENNARRYASLFSPIVIITLPHKACLQLNS